MSIQPAIAFPTGPRHSSVITSLFALSMPQKPTLPYQLVPELSLLAPLAKHQRKRFETALSLLHSSLAEHLSWEKIAEKSAISSYHFHREFTRLFNETPGHYQSRIRLQYAVHHLMSSPHYSVTDIALLTGYSSSQALAKALKRELNTNAKAIRSIGETGTPQQTEQLLAKLAHPHQDHSIEQALAEALPCELIWQPQRSFKRQPLADFSWERLFKTMKQDSTQMLCCTPIKELEGPWSKMNYQVGNWQVSEQDADDYIAEGYYFCCEVYIVSDVAYLSAISSLFEQAQRRGYEIDEDAKFVEMVRHIELKLAGGVTFSFQIPIKS